MSTSNWIALLLLVGLTMILRCQSWRGSFSRLQLGRRSLSETRHFARRTKSEQTQSQSLSEKTSTPTAGAATQTAPTRSWSRKRATPAELRRSPSPVNANTHTHLPAQAAVQSPTQMQTPVQMQPLKAMLFIDGTWLYYSLFYNRDRDMNPVIRRLGLDWSKNYCFCPEKMVSLVAQNLNKQLSERSAPRQVEVVRANVFTSTKNDTFVGGSRDSFVKTFLNNAQFDVHLFDSKADEEQEKCVDVAMAVEMVYMATIPNAFDIAVMVGGDKDFLPAIEKTRSLAKSVALCSMRNSCNRELLKPLGRCKDFEMIWMDSVIDSLFVPKSALQDETSDSFLLHKILQTIFSLYDLTKPVSSRDLGRQLSMVELNSGRGLVDIIRNYHGSLKSFLEKFPQLFTFSQPAADVWEFLIALNPAVVNKYKKTEIPENVLNELNEFFKSTERESSEEEKEPVYDDPFLLDITLNVFASLPKGKHVISGRELGKSLGMKTTDSGKNCLDVMKASYRSLRAFLEKYPEHFTLGPMQPTDSGFEYNITVNASSVNRPPAKNGGSPPDAKTQEMILQTLLKTFAKLPQGMCELSNRDLGRALTSIKMENGKNCLDVIKAGFYSVRSFIEQYPAIFRCTPPVFSGTGYEYIISVDPAVSSKYREEVAFDKEAHKKTLDFLADVVSKRLISLPSSRASYLNDVTDILNDTFIRQGESAMQRLNDLGISVRFFIELCSDFFSLGPYKMSPHGYDQTVILSSWPPTAAPQSNQTSPPLDK